MNLIERYTLKKTIDKYKLRIIQLKAPDISAILYSIAKDNDNHIIKSDNIISYELFINYSKYIELITNGLIESEDYVRRLDSYNNTCICFKDLNACKNAINNLCRFIMERVDPKYEFN